MIDRFVDLGPFPTVLEAEQTRGLLEEAGIESFVEGQSAGTIFGGSYAMGIIRLLVRAEDAERAIAVIEGRERLDGDDSRPASRGEVDAAPTPGERPPTAPVAPPAGSPTAPSDPYMAEAWARQTRRIALVSVLFVWLFIGAISRVTSPPPPEVLASPKARRMLLQARLIIYAWMVLLLTSGGLLGASFARRLFYGP